jgi:hypothetical protein
MTESAVPVVIGVLTLAAVLYVIYAAFKGLFGGRGKVSADGKFICPHCGTRGVPRLQTRGSTAIEVVAWLLLIVPGILYSLWRLSTRHPVCPSCRQPGMIPADSPRGRTLGREGAAV